MSIGSVLFHFKSSQNLNTDMMFPVEISEHFKFFLCNCCKGQKKKKKSFQHKNFSRLSISYGNQGLRKSIDLTCL